MSAPNEFQQRVLQQAEQHDEQWRRDNVVPLREQAEIRERGGLPPEAVEALKGRSVDERAEDQDRRPWEMGF